MQPENSSVACAECEHGPETGPMLGRRDFIRAVATHTAALAAVGTGAVGLARAADDKPAAAKAMKPAEALVRELFATFDETQKKSVCLPWDHGANGGKGLPTRLGMYNAPIAKKIIGVEYKKPQVELLDRIFRTIANGEEGYRRLSRGGKFDNSGDFESIGAVMFGEPTDGKKFSLVFSGHHLTVRCDGNSEPDAAFGGPLYYGHSPNGYSDKNVFFYQTKSVWSVFDSLSAEQRKAAMAPGSPGEQAGSVQFRKKGESHPGLGLQEISKDQKALIETVMRDLISPFRAEDADEVMEIVKANGGLEKINLAFYADKSMNDKQPWHFWRLEGPGFVWNFRVLPHVHTFVNIRGKLA